MRGGLVWADSRIPAAMFNSLMEINPGRDVGGRGEVFAPEIGACPSVHKARCQPGLSPGTNRSCRAAPRLVKIINGVPVITSRFAGGVRRLTPAAVKRLLEFFGCSCRSRLRLKGTGELLCTSSLRVSLQEWFPSFRSGRSPVSLFHLCVSSDLWAQHRS